MAPVPLLFLLFFLHQPLSSSLSDSGALLLLKSSFLNPNPALSSWSTPSTPATSHDESPTSPCTASWIGVLCLRGFVTGLRLAGLGLQGTINIDALSHFRSLRSISFNNNNLSGPLPNIGRLDALKSIYLSNNRFAGSINDSLFLSMDHLKKLWLDGNLLSGRIPSSLSKVSMLIDLRLEGNNFTGDIPALQLPSLRYFNVSNNDLQGPIPTSLVHFGAAAFAGNPNLCGPPLPGPACPIPTTYLKAVEQREGDSHSGKLVLIVLGILLVFLALVIGYAAVKSRRQDQFADSFIDHHDAVSVSEAMEAAAAASPVQLPSASSSRRRSKKRSGSNRGSGGGGGSNRGGGSELVMVNDEKGVFGLPDLMRASAEVLGNGGLGSVYKAAMDNGVSVAVKRMRELNRLNKEGFDREMRRLGRLQHPNLLPPLAYHFRKEEKLVVSEYVAKGSLLYILHGDRGEEHAALDWPTRLKIIRGIARAMSYLHAELDSYDLPHGNLKTGNVLLGPDFEPILADYGLIALVNPAAAPNVLFAFKSPEAPHVSPKSDVYCFGVVILEIITGKFPSQYLNNTKGGIDVVHWGASAVAERREADLIDPQIMGLAASGPEMIRMLRVGVACTKLGPEERPGMKEAAEMVEEIADGGGGGIESISPIVPTQPWREGSLRGSRDSRRSERSVEAAQEPWSGDLLSLY
ncbi:pollen receptor-like kinase 3 [Dendrobium catenatum]|uniref:Putative inactive leucine-rich repeat receptor-like protein kinase n=1 Tax=Dendrobium catenatum TaxID=906689 RepID=A0A2I0XAH2_9ASPA|nr:pollen receptor-like kinase 3 [Dendrobium catenatum]PKU84927.1 putative inactive leucine-rich repeat receptor-like protein kinase [Dendrobium catenatum]